MKKRVLSLLLVLAMFVTLAPIAAFATDTTEHSHTETVTAVPAEEKPVVPTEEPTVPAEEKPATPTEKPATPTETESKPTVPAEEKPVTPTETDPAEKQTDAPTAPDAVAAAQALIDALPAPEDFTPADVDAYFAACDALDLLSPEQLELITGMDKLAAIEALLNDPAFADDPASATGETTQESAAATVYVETVAHYFDSLVNAAAYAGSTPNVAKVELNQDASITATLNLTGTYTLDLNGKNITGDTSAITIDGQITLTGTGNIAPSVTVNASKKLTVDASYNGTISAVTVVDSGYFEVKAVGTNLHVNTLTATIRSTFSVQLAGGTYGSIDATFSSEAPATAKVNAYAWILDSGYAFKSNGTTLVPWSSMNGSVANISVISQGTHTDNKKYYSTSIPAEQEGSDGMCDYCCATLRAKLTSSGVTTYYTTIDAALADANTKTLSAVTLLNDANLSAPLTITAPVDIDLNGFLLSNNAVTLTLNNSLVVRNNGSAQKEFQPKIKVATGSGTTVGTFSPIGDNMDFHEVIFSGGLFNDCGAGCLYRKISTDVTGGKLLDVLPTDTNKTYAFYKYNSSTKFKSTDVANAAVTSLNNVYVGEHTHTITDGKCACGFECTHTNINETSGYCSDCKTTYAAKVTKADGTLIGYYTTLDQAVKKQSPAGTYTIKLLNSVTLSAILTNITQNVKLDLNGKNISYADSVETKRWLTLSNFEIVGSGSISGTIMVTGGRLTIDESCSANIDHVAVSGNCSLTVEPGSTVTMSKLETYPATGTVSLAGGTYNEIKARSNYSKAAYADHLANGYCYADADNAPLPLANNMAKNTTVKVIAHTVHSGYETDGECDYCGAKFALLTTATGEETLYTSLDAALAAANANPGCTVKLLCDMPLLSDITLSSAFTIDLNGHAVKSPSGSGVSVPKITIASNVTFESSSATGSPSVNVLFTVASGGTLTIPKRDGDIQIKFMATNNKFDTGSVLAATGSVYFQGFSVDTGKKIIDLLPEGYAFQYGSDPVSTDGSVNSANEGIIIINHPTCTWADDPTAETTTSKCDCGRVCTHENLENGKCQKCQTQFYAEHTYTSGAATVKKLYAELEKALVNAETNGGTVKLLTDYTANSMGLLKSYTLDLNGHNITLTTGDTGNFNVYGTITLTDSSSATKGTVKAECVNVYDGAENHGKLTVDGGVTIERNTAGSSETVHVYNGGELVLNNGTINGKVKVTGTNSTSAAPSKLVVTGGTFNGQVIVTNGATAALSGGTFAEIQVDNSAQFPGLLVGGYAFFNNANAPIALSTNTATKLQNVAVKKCTDHKPAADGKCDYCGEELTFEVTYTADGATVTKSYTADQYDAAHAEVVAQNGNGTLKLLKDYQSSVSLDCAGSYTIDLNGHTFTCDGVYNVFYNITITDSSSGTKGKFISSKVEVYKSGGNGKLTVDGGVTLESFASSSEYDTVYVHNGGELVLNNGTINGKVKVTGTNSKLTVTGGTFNNQGDYGQIDVEDGATATLSGGTVNHVLHVTDANATISGGAFNGTGMQVVNSTVALSGGTFGVISIPAADTADTTITSLLASTYGYHHTESTYSEMWTLKGDDTNNKNIYKVEVKKLPVQNLTVTSAPAAPKYGEAITLSASATDASGAALAAPTATYQWYQKSGDSWADIADATSADYKPYDGTTGTAPTPGAYEYKCAVTNDGYTAEKEITVTVANADSGLTGGTPKAKADLVYSGSAQALLDVTGITATHGKLVFSLDKDGTYSETIPTGTDAKEYTVWYKVEGDTNYNDTAPQSVKATIARCPVKVKDIADSSGNPKSHSKVYDGTKTLIVSRIIFTDKDGNALTWQIGDDYTIGACNFDTADVGKDKTITCSVTLRNKNYYMINDEGAEIFAVTFNDGEITKATPTINVTNVDNNNILTLTYGDTATITATAQKAGPFVQDEPGALSFRAKDKADSDIISVDSATGKITPKKAGTATVTITSAATDNYNKGSKEITVKVEKRALTLRAAALTAHVGDTAPDLSAPVLGTHYTLEGLVNGDTALDSGVTVTLAYQGLTGSPVMSAPGTYVITAQTSNNDSRYAITCVNGSLTVENITITATAGAGGSIAPSGKVDVAVNSSKTFTITPASGYAVANVKVDGVGVGAVRSYTFTNITTSHTIEAIFMPVYGNPQTGVDVA